MYKGGNSVLKHNLKNIAAKLSTEASDFAPEIEILSKSYSEVNFQRFCCKMFGIKDAKTAKIVVDKEFKGVVNISRVAEYEDDTLEVIIGLSVELDKNTYKGNQRAYQRGVVSYILNLSRDYKKAIVAFHTKDEKVWRLSYIKVGDYLEDTIIVPMHRWSFLVGENEPCRTIKESVSKLVNAFNGEPPSVDDIEKAFTVENAVTDIFYEKFRDHYKDMCDSVMLKNRTESRLEVERRVKSVMGQVVALFFLQKCGFLGVKEDSLWGTGDKYYVTKKVEAYYGNNIYNDIFSPLMRALAGDGGIDGERIPVINGGLFTVIDAFQDGREFSIHTAKFKNFIKMLSEFNFTISESTPYDKDIAVDPEMLGKIYESFITTEDEDGRNTKKLTGAVYTPTDIVDSMCKESLSAWLIKKVKGISQDDLDELIDFPELNLELLYSLKAEKMLLNKGFIKYIGSVDKELEKLTFLEPSVGSGAFLVGMLLNIVKLRSNLGIMMHFLRDIDNKTYENYSIYNLKLHAAKKNIYGVDINAGAVDIARLRVWLSLIVDMQEPQQLPNLDFRIVVGNSIIDGVGGQSLLPEGFTAGLDELEKLKDIYLVKEHGSKFSARDEVTSKIVEILDSAGNGSTISFSIEDKGKRLFVKDIKSQDQLDSLFKYVFSFDLVFSEVMRNGGFDIIIGNPPYVRGRIIPVGVKEELQVKYGVVYHGNADLLVYFYANGVNLLKEDGILSFVVSRTWLSSDYAYNLRKFLFTNTELLSVVDFGENRLFKGVGVDTSISIIRKAKPSEDGAFVYCNGEGYTV